MADDMEKASRLEVEKRTLPACMLPYAEQQAQQAQLAARAAEAAKAAQTGDPTSSESAVIPTGPVVSSSFSDISMSSAVPTNPHPTEIGKLCITHLLMLIVN